MRVGNNNTVCGCKLTALPYQIGKTGGAIVLGSGLFTAFNNRSTSTRVTVRVSGVGMSVIFLTSAV